MDTENWNIVNKKNKKIVSRLDLHYDKFNWSGTLQELTQAKTLVNQALGGASNKRILRTTLEYVMSLDHNQRKNTLVVIGWTASEREEIYFNNAWHLWNPSQKFSYGVDINHPIDSTAVSRLDAFQEDYLSMVFNDYPNILNYFSNAYLLSNTLSNLGVRHLFFNALPPWWEAGHSKADCDPFEKMPTLLNWHESSRNLLSFRDSMMGFVHRTDKVVGKYLHPLTDAHDFWGRYLFQQLQQRNII
jgi:hypothetical protein